MNYIFDTFTNFLSGLGVPGRDKLTASQYVTTVWTRQQLEDSFRGDWIARKAIAIPAFDATREWRSWQAEQAQIEKLEETEERLQVQLKLQQALTKARLYGGCCILIGVDGKTEKELDPDTIKKQALTKARLYGGCCILIGVDGKTEKELDPDTIKKDGLKFLHVLAPHQVKVEELIKDLEDPNYYDRIASEQQLRLTPALEKLDKAIVRSALGKADENIFYEWRPLWQMDETEKATIQKQKADAAKVDADSGLVPFNALVQGRCNQLIEDGTYPGLEAALEDAIEDQELLAERAQEEAPLKPDNENFPGAEEDEGMEGGPPGAQPKKKQGAVADGIGPFGMRLREWVRSGTTLHDRLVPWDESKHPRDPGGEGGGQFITAGGEGSGRAREGSRSALRAGFVSPSVKTSLDFKGAVQELSSRQQGRLRLASADINKKLSITNAREVNIIGVWVDPGGKPGAENSIMSRSDADWNKTVVGTVMKGHLADQKSVLVFQQQERGVGVLAQFEANGKLETIHKNLLKDGIEHHTVVPNKDGDGATIYVVDLDGTSLEKLDKAAERACSLDAS